MAHQRVPATAVSAFTIDGDTFLSALENAHVKVDAKHEEASAVNDLWDYAWPTKYHAEIDADMFIEGSSLVPQIGVSVLLFYTTGGNSYSGQFVITSVGHTVPHAGLQKQKIMFMGQGQPVVDSIGS